MLSGGFRKKDNIHLLNNSEISEKFMQINFPAINPEINYTEKTISTTSIHISPALVLSIIQSKKESSAPGFDQISYFLLKNLNFKTIVKTSEILNDVLHTPSYFQKTGALLKLFLFLSRVKLTLIRLHIDLSL
jgi:hypothetical protein